MAIRKRETIAVAMSGGVDSAVAAALLKRQGYDVIGLFAKTWTPTPGDGTTCTWVADRRDALRVAAALDIPLVSIDAEVVYRREVIERWLAGYRRGETPNPDVWCNRVVKFGLLWQAAQRLGASSLATGHYARVRAVKTQNTKHKRYELLRGRDRQKDQSYFLWDISASILAHIRFPVGHLTKKTVRQLARKYQLPVAEKKDSQGICLLGPMDVRTFLRQWLRATPGPVYDWKTGARVGTHDGLVGVTIGQRHGVQMIEDRRLRTASEPAYVVAIDPAHNSLLIGPRHALLQNGVVVREVNWLDEGMCESLMDCRTYQVQAQIRYRQTPVPTNLRLVSPSILTASFGSPVAAPTPGQSIVFYDGSRVLGGGVIDQVMDKVQ